MINGSRRTRIANGSGTTVGDVNRLVKQFAEMQKMMKRMGGMGLGKAGKKGKKSPRHARHGRHAWWLPQLQLIASRRSYSCKEP